MSSGLSMTPTQSLFAVLLVVNSASLVAQPVAIPTPRPVYASDPTDMLAVNLKILAQNPYDVTALTQAGLGALAGGDPSAAIGFLARAEELSPRNGKIKAALASALVMMEKPTEALRLFGEATTLGYAEADIASDRGLAFDLLGQNKAAHKDYALAMRYHKDSELVRRYALSLGIVGDKKAALDLLTPLLEREDQAAWRARAFILAMNGDVEEADRIVRAVTPLSLQGTMTPFLRRLATLNLSQRAYAVNFGTMPAEGVRYAMVDPGDSFRSIGNGAIDGLMPKKEVVQPRTLSAPKPEESTRDARKRQKQEKQLASLAERGRTAISLGTSTVAATKPPSEKPPAVDSLSPDQGSLGRRVGARIAAVDPARLPPEIRPPSVQADGSTARTAPTIVTLIPTMKTLPPPGAAADITPVPAPAPVVVVKAVNSETIAPDPVPGFTLSPAASAPAPSTDMLSETAADTNVPPPPVFEVPPAQSVKVTQVAANEPPVVMLVPATLPPAPVQQAVVAPPKAGPPIIVSEPKGLAAIMAGLVPESETVAAPLPSDAELRTARLAAKRKLDAELKAKIEADAEAVKKAEAASTAKRNPPRIWVQIATGANRAGLPGTWKKLQGQASKTLAGQSASFVGFKATNRLLVGPFKSTAEARAMVTKLAKDGIVATNFSSDAGQEIAKIGGK